MANGHCNIFHMTFLPLSPTLLRVTWRHLTHHPLQTLLLIKGIMLGVAVVVAIDVANASASAAFDLSVEAVSGRATYQIVGGPDGFNDQIYVDLKRQGLEEPIAPALSEYVSSPDLGNISLQLLGIDAFAEPPFRDYLSASDSSQTVDLAAFLVRPDTVFISSANASRYSLKSGQSIRLVIGGREHQVTIAGLLQPSAALARRAVDGLVIADIATAQELTGRIGKLDRIDLIVPESSEQEVTHISAMLPPDVRLVPVSARTGTIREMTDAFRLNLTALSLLALIVGMFLIYNTMTFSVVQRRALFGTLRCLGVTGGEIFGLIIAEAITVGVLGSALGLGLGVLLGQGAVKAVIQTINDLYFTVSIQGLQVPASSLVKGAILGVGATVATAIPPAREAASVPARTALIRSGVETKARLMINRSALIGLGTILAAAGVLAIPTHDLVISFAGTFLMILGFALLSPRATLFLMDLFLPITARLWGNVGRMAPRNVSSSSSRTTIAVAALMIAVSVTIGISVMIGSFRATVIQWLGQTLQSDIYISVPGGTAVQPSEAVDPAVLTALKNVDGIARVDTLRAVEVDSPRGPIHVSATDNYSVGTERIYVRQAHPDDQMWQAMQAGEVLVSEPLANQADLPVSNASITLVTDHGLKTFPVAGVFYDYSSSQGTVIMAANVYHALWTDTAITAIGIRLKPGLNADTVTQSVQHATSSIQQLSIQPNQTLRANVLTIFDRTFAITGALQMLATLVAFVGILSSFLALELEKQREIGILRTIGMTVQQVWGLIMLETGLMGAAAGILAAPTGMVLALILTYIINRRSFGWTLQMSVDASPFLAAFAIAVTAALLAGLYPAGRISRAKPADAVHFE